MKLPLHWKWFLGLAILIADLLLVIYLCLGFTLPPYLQANVRADLHRSAILAREAFATKLTDPDKAWEINALAHKLARETGLRVTIIAPDGTVIGESDKPVEALGQIENQFQRPEVQQAIREGVGSATRHSATIDEELLYVALPVRKGGDTPSLAGIVRVAMPLAEIQQTTARVRRTVAVAILLVGAITIPFLFWMSRRTTSPIEQMRAVAGRIARCDFPRRVRIKAGGELGDLGEALDKMSGQLRARLEELNEEKTELSAILSSMTEGVVVVDGGGKIRLLNEAFREQFQIGNEAIGKTILEAVRNVALQELILEASKDGSVSARELTFLNPDERIFDVDAASLRAPDGVLTGTVVVFHDITRIKKLENIRKEFVANVSHELRTPLSIVKGYVETLLDESPPDEQTAKQFLKTIDKNTRRLEALIDDLLTISALESQQAKLDLAPVSLRATAEAVADELANEAKGKSISVTFEVPDDFPLVRADAQRLHQILFNLIDNAVKYTQADGKVTISAAEKNGEIEVCVADNGPGIAPEHLPRIFERFYRADKARSRELGGTGLGLSIVKHIVQAHGGRVWAESELQKGSRFYFTLRRA